MEGIYTLALLTEKTGNEEAVLVYFSSESCHVCKTLKPKVNELLQQRFPHMLALYVDIEKSPVISGQHRVFSIPTLLVYFQGKEHLRVSRNISIHQLEKAIEKPYRLIFE
jgi:thioredoxin-like negative regulator of GroEL